MRVKGWVYFGVGALLQVLLCSCTSEAVNREPMVNLGAINAGEIKLADLNKALRQNQNNPSLYAKRAKIYLQQNKLDLALTDIQKAIELNDNQEEFYFWKAVILRNQNQINQALEIAKEAEILGLKDPNNYLLQTELLLLKKRFNDALVKVGEVLNADPENAFGLYYKGLVRASLGDTVSAVILYKRAVRVAPDFIYPYLQLSSIFNAQKDFEQAFGFLKTGARLDTTNGYLWYQHGIRQNGLKNTDSAYSSFKKAVKLGPNQYLANYELGLLYYKKAAFDQAADNMEVVKAQDPNLPFATEILAESYEKTGRYKEAVVEYNKILRRKPNDVRTMWGIRRSNYGLYKFKRDSLYRIRSRSYNFSDTTNYN